MSVYDEVVSELESLRDERKAALLRRFFKTGKGEYGEGDRFLGIVVPLQRKVVRKYQDLPMGDVVRLLRSRWHECRLVALLILVRRFEQAVKKEDAGLQKRVVDLYLSNTASINNWDLVDLSAPRILGRYVFARRASRTILYTLAKSGSVWERRIAVLSTFWFISKGDVDDSLLLAGLLMSDKHDLIHKAVGWMLREVGKKDEVVLRRFLDEHAPVMPRTMLRYALERLDASSKKRFLSLPRQALACRGSRCPRRRAV